MLTCMVFTIGRAQAPLEVKNIDLPDMYRQIDEAISQSPRYIADYEEKISKAKQTLETADDEQRLMQLMEISRMYESFCGDSAQVYTERALELARQGGYNAIEGEDGADLVEWVARQPWCNGKVAMSGTSYLSFSQWFIAAERPEHLVCTQVTEALTDGYRDMCLVGGMLIVGYGYRLTKVTTSK